MRIEEVRTEAMVAGKLACLLVHVRSSEGLVGTGECWWGVAATDGQPADAPVRATAAVVDTILAPLCVGRDPSRIEEIWSDLAEFTYRWGDGGMVMCALSGIDLALWDLAGQRHGTPVMDLLGGGVHESLPGYASRPTRDIDTLAVLRRELPVAIAAGENEWSVLDADRLLRAGAVDYFQPEVTKIGGLTPGLRQSALAEAHRVAFCPHNFRAGPSLAASIHWAFSSPVARWIEIRWLPQGVEPPAGWNLPSLVDGRVAPPTRPGLSMA